jgi:hypothetical protein
MDYWHLVLFIDSEHHTHDQLCRVVNELLPEGARIEPATRPIGRFYCSVWRRIEEQELKPFFFRLLDGDLKACKRYILALDDEDADHLLSLYIPNDGRDRAKHMVAKIGHEPVSARIHSDDNPTPGEILDFAFNITGVTLTWRFADANQMMLAVQDALAMGLLNGLPNQKMAKVV